MVEVCIVCQLMQYFIEIAVKSD